MAFNRIFDEEIGRAAQLSCLNDGTHTYGLGLTDTTNTLTDIVPGIYDVFLDGMSASATVLLKPGRSSDSLVEPTSTPRDIAMFPGSVMARIRVLPGQNVLSARLLTSGTGTLFLVQVVEL